MNETKKNSWWQSGLFVLAGLAAVAAFGIRTISNGEVWGSLAAGRSIVQQGVPRVDTFSFTGAGSPWVDSTWLYDWLLYRLWTIGHAPLVIVLHTAIVVLAFVLLLPLARKWAGDVSVSLALLVSAWLLSPRFTVSAEIFCLVFLAAFMAVLSDDRKAWMPWAVLVPLQILWTSMHGSFFLGPLIAGLFALDLGLKERSAGGHRAVAMALLTAVLLIVTFANPYGARLHLYLLRSALDVSYTYVQEWISPFSAQFSGSVIIKHTVTLALLIGAGGLITERRRLPVAVTTLAVFGAFLVVRSLRYIDLFVILAFPFMALSLHAVGATIEERLASIRSALRIGAGVIALLLAVLTLGLVFSNRCYASIGSASSAGLGVEYDLFPNAAARVIARPDFPRRMVNMAFDGGFLAWQAPQQPIFVDARASLYGEEFFKIMNRWLVGVDEAWKMIEDRWDPGAVVINCCAPGAGTALRSVLASGRWALVYFDGTTVILVRSVSDNRKLIGDSALQDEGLALLESARKLYAARVAGGEEPGVAPRLIGAGNVFIALGRYAEAETVYRLLVAGAPSMGNALLNLGISQVELGKGEEAVQTLRRVTGVLPKQVYGWLYLSRACQLAGLTDESQQAYDRAKELNPKAASMFAQNVLNPGKATPPPAPAPAGP